MDETLTSRRTKLDSQEPECSVEIASVFPKFRLVKLHNTEYSLHIIKMLVFIVLIISNMVHSITRRMKDDDPSVFFLIVSCKFMTH